MDGARHSFYFMRKLLQKIILFTCVCIGVPSAKAGNIGLRNVFSGKLLSSMNIKDSGGTTAFTFNYNEDFTRLLSIRNVATYSNRSYVTNCSFDYSQIQDNIVTMNIEETEDDYVASIRLELNADGFITKATEFYYDITSSWEFKYNDNKQLCYVKFISSDNYGSELKENTITYQNGDIARIEYHKSYENEDSYDWFVPEYTQDKVENRGGIMYDMGVLYGIDLGDEDIEYAWFAGLLGKPCEHLPVKLFCHEEDSYGEVYEGSYPLTWTLDADGYPSSGFLRRENWEYVWTDIPAGMQELYPDGGKVNDFYTADGMKSGSLRKGLNLVRTADGKVRKVFVK